MNHKERATPATRAILFVAAVSTAGLFALSGGCGQDQVRNDSGGGGISGQGGTGQGGTVGTGGSTSSGGSAGRAGAGGRTGNGGGAGSSNPAGGGASGSGGCSCSTGGCGCNGGTAGGAGGASSSGGAAGGGATADAGVADAPPDRPATDGPSGGDVADAVADRLLSDAAKDQVSADSVRDAVSPTDVVSGDAGPAAVQLVGRFAPMDSTPAGFGWSGSAMIARFSGTGASLRMDGSANQFAVLIDGALSQAVLKVTGGSTPYQVAQGLGSGTHDLVIWKRTEGSQGSNNFLGLDIAGGQLLAPPARPDRRIEIYGDSISAGYGMDGQGPSCTASQDNENHYLTYGAVAARTLLAELHTIAWSGIGMYRNYGQSGPSSDAMPAVYDRTLAASASSATNTWDFTTWQPQAVVINLGTNDASTNGDPGTPYRTAYLDFVRTLRQKYPDTFFILSIGPMLSGSSLDAIRGHLQAVIQTRAGEGDSKMSYLEFPVQTSDDGYGCDWHPSAATNAKMADLLVAEIRKQLSW